MYVSAVHAISDTTFPISKEYVATIGGTRVFFDRPITSDFTSSPLLFRSTWKYVVTDRRTLFLRLLTPFPIRNSLSHFSHMPQRARFVGVLLTSCARRENIRKYVCMCRRGFGVNVPGTQSTIGCVKIAGENCKENVVANRGREEETSEAVQKCGRRGNPLCESRFILLSRWTVRSRVSVANKNKTNAYFRCWPEASYLHTQNPVCTCIR